ncbi:MAG: glucans biosynthesis glucosyltransferase MdoH [Thiofilum sp.]|uniref:glucans biosynthesis glucosyltransferase MdoH n=1 Tax=Thiofilum sp. TaxID=2212733 RepID=UPI0025F7EAA6|nr:glucans biosynthesis glucosyltransferase MdoH [Thiofilum sp.]MBK8451944.1 glucans biosynthesis glucosyltransferase MdoH [Thiofilum sp.]
MLQTLALLDWRQTALQRRLFVFSMIALMLIWSVSWLTVHLPEVLPWWWKALIVIPFAVLLFWLALGFVTALTGLWVLMRRGRFRVLPSSREPVPPLPTHSTTAILLPVYNEDVAYVFAGIKSMYQSLQAGGWLEHFEFYVLSDSDKSRQWLREGAAWQDLCDELDAHGRIHYRHRRHRIKKKSGNIMDFCRRWGNRHEYMIVLDADSLVTGETFARLVTAMERNPRIGLIQTPLYATGLHTLFARSQQFVNRLYGPVFFAGLHYWWMGDSQYWGHNVIIRTSAFMQHCDLPRLAASGSLGGDILSHDFVEAALLNRAGWETWLAFDLDGSFERPPPTLTDALKRDRRWCLGNLQHWQIIWSRDIPHMQRFLMLGGIMSYVGSLIWLFWLMVLSVTALSYPREDIIENSFFSDSILVITLILLFVYKLFGVIHIIKRGYSQLFGGLANLWMGIVTETLMSILIAPIRMMYYSRFVIEILLGKRANWGTQQREGYKMSWASALREYAWIMIPGLLWAVTLASVNPVAFWWTAPVLLGLILAAPVAVLTSYELAPKAGLFTTPDLQQPMDVLQTFPENHLDLSERSYVTTHDPFTRVVVDPVAQQQHMAYVPRRQVSAKTREQRDELFNRALRMGPVNLTEAERQIFLEDSSLLARLHTAVWQLPEKQFQQQWLSHL